MDKIYGLNDAEVIESKKKNGTNDITNTTKNSFLKLLIESLGDPIIKILLIALAIKVVFLLKEHDWYETVGIVIAIFLASFISTISEYGSEKVFKKLQEESSKLKVRVKRNNKIVEISITDVVVGDIVLLSTGDKIPADGIIIDGELSVDESSINGESKEIYKRKSNNIEESMLFRGTTVYNKNAIMRVTKVGDNTFYGKLALEVQAKTGDSPLKLRLRSLAQFISRIGYVCAFLVSFSYLFSVIVLHNNFNLIKIYETITDIPLIVGYLLYAATLMVTVIVVAVPEGLPMMITLVLSSNMRKMIKNNVLVRKLVGIETAGNINVLLTDKTGTLTKGKLEVSEFVTASLRHYKNVFELQSKGIYDIVKSSMLINNESSYDGDVIGGNTTDKALANFFKEPIKKDIANCIPFDSKNKFSMVTLKNGLGLIKGAPEKIMPFCTKYYDEDGKIKTLLSKREINKEIEKYTKQGIRVLVMASFLENVKSLTYVGFVLIKDEIREEVKEAIQTVKDAHIDIIMITGDNKETATNIAEEINLLENGIVLTKIGRAHV